MLFVKYINVWDLFLLEQPTSCKIMSWHQFLGEKNDESNFVTITSCKIILPVQTVWLIQRFSYYIYFKQCYRNISQKILTRTTGCTLLFVSIINYKRYLPSTVI